MTVVATTEDDQTIRAAFDASSAGDLNKLPALFSPDLEWTFFDPSEADPDPDLPGVDDLQGALHGRPEPA